MFVLTEFILEIQVRGYENSRSRRGDTAGGLGQTNQMPDGVQHKVDDAGLVKSNKAACSGRTSRESRMCENQSKARPAP